MDHPFSNANFPFGVIWTTIEFTLSLWRYIFLDLSLLNLSELLSNSFIENIFLRCKIQLISKSRNYALFDGV